MAIYEVKREWSPEQLGYVRHFLLHNEADVKNLPACCVGSRGHVSDTDNEYVYTVNGWMLESECEEIRPGGGTSGVDEVARQQIAALTEEIAKLPTTGGTQSDWSVNDESDPTYVKNRTHYEQPVVREIEWDGDMSDRLAIDLASFGVEGMYLVKVSDRVYTQEGLLSKCFISQSGDVYYFSKVGFVDALPGSIGTTNLEVVVIYDADTLCAEMGAPEGSIQNGTYFCSVPSAGAYIQAIETVYVLVKLDEKYLPDSVVRRVQIDLYGNEACVLDGGWSTYSVDLRDGQTSVEAGRRWVSTLCEVIFALRYSDHNQQKVSGIVQFSGTAPLFSGMCMISGYECGDVQVYIKADIANNTVSIAAKTLDI